MNIQQQLNNAISEFELLHQRKPQKLIVDWRTRADLAMLDALPDLEIENATVEWRVIRLE